MGALDNGGPAFPGGYMADEKGRGPVCIFSPGMSLRDWFAGQALAGMLSDPASTEDSEEFIAREAYRQADAMLAERDRERS